jgi:hypothetical protein
MAILLLDDEMVRAERTSNSRGAIHQVHITKHGRTRVDFLSRFLLTTCAWQTKMRLKIFELRATIHNICNSTERESESNFEAT